MIRGFRARLNALIEASRPQIKVPCLELRAECAAEVNAILWRINDGKLDHILNIYIFVIFRFANKGSVHAVSGETSYLQRGPMWMRDPM